MTTSVFVNDVRVPERHRNLNPDAIYAAMAWLREYVESPQGQATYRELLDRKTEKVDALRSLFEGTVAAVHIRPSFSIPDELVEEIYPGEPDSVKAGLELGHSVIWGPPGAAGALLQSTFYEHNSAAAIALGRFIADRAN